MLIFKGSTKSSGSRAVIVVRVRHCLSVLVYAGLSMFYSCRALLVTGCTCIYAYNLALTLVTKSRWTWQPSPTSLGICGLRSRRLQCRIECLKRCCRLHDIKRVTASCHNDVMISYKSSRPIGNTKTFGSFFGYRPPIEPSTVFVQLCALPEPFQRLSLFP